jgi:putative redox protein
MKATATRAGNLRQAIRIRDFNLTIDEPADKGGEDTGPSPQEMLAASLAACTAITMEMYAKRKGWDVGDVEVACDYTPAERGCPTRFNLVMRFPDSMSDEMVERLRVIAAKCPVHRTLEGEVMFDERVERVSLARLDGVLLDPAEAAALDVHGRTDAAVLVPLFLDADGAPRVVLTRRREDLRRHAGEISFPGGREDDDDADLCATALREAQEEIGLDPDAVEVIGALQPTPTIATNFAVYPFVGLIEPGTSWRPAEAEVAEVLELRLDDLRAGYDRRRMLRRGVPFRTDTYVVGDQLVWGATARMLADLFERMDRAAATATT